MPHDYVLRRIETELAEAMGESRVVLVEGPRQAGKSTLVQRFADASRPYLTLDDANVLGAARADPIGFVRGLDRAVIDEIQRAPELMLAIKASVDRDPRPGRFLLTGSANVMSLPRIADSMAGRLRIVTLLPFALSELHSGSKRRRRETAPNVIDQLFDGAMPTPPRRLIQGAELMDEVLIGGYPEARLRGLRAVKWLRDYVRLVLDRDAREIATIEQLDALPRLLGLLAEQAAQLANIAALAQPLGMNAVTTSRYVGILERMFLLTRIKPWHSNRITRLIKTPKIHFYDSGLLATLRGDTAARLAKERSRYGALLENFAVAELMKARTWAQTPTSLSHFRTKDGDEVDLVLEDPRGRIVGIEIKAAATLSQRDFSGLKKLKAAAGERFVRGLLLHDHDQMTPIDENLHAHPLSVLW
jgi:uncharacterized protein